MKTYDCYVPGISQPSFSMTVQAWNEKHARQQIRENYYAKHNQLPLAIHVRLIR